MKCKTPGCERTDLIYSGVDAFVRGLPATEKYCYPCGNAYYTIRAEVDALVQKEEAEKATEVVADTSI